MVGEDRVELSPRVPKTRMLALHHTPEEVRDFEGPMSKVCSIAADIEHWTLDAGLPFDTDHLLNLRDNFNQIFLILHYRFD